ncbi:MAG: galactokinase [Chloroflexota bacterium]|nr:MAG: galactokinase [Chloroflexota bacterium]
MTTIQDRVKQAFVERVGSEPSLVVRAPGRVNIIGEHTDYNDGFVLPMAIDRAVYIALRPRHDQYVIVESLDFDEIAEISLIEMVHRPPEWSEYVRGVAWAMQEAGMMLSGWEGVVAGDVPIGAGLSSSAALEMATARAFAAVSGLTWEPAWIAKIGQKTENLWIGVNSGIMDQLISAAGRAGHALLIDCRSLETQAVPLPPDTRIVVLDTATRRGLVGSAYNERRQQCEAAARHFGVKALRDVTPEMFAEREHELDDVTRRRARHVITENARTLAAAEAMRRGDAVELGRLMNESHVSMRDDFEISREEVDAMVACAQAHDASFGARMTGGGFGGCCVALVRAADAQTFAADVAACYTQATGLTPTIYVCEATDGASVVETLAS